MLRRPWLAIYMTKSPRGLLAYASQFTRAHNAPSGPGPNRDPEDD